jgi:YD repeat-containing protein
MGMSSTNAYAYQGNTVTATDAAGKWKTFETDVFGNLTKVTEPNPGGGTVDSLYTYNLRNQVKQVTMTRGAVTQTRTFAYDGQWRLQTATNPETGTATYTYNADNTVATKVDAKNQKVAYVYDGQQRVTQVKRYPVSSGSEDTCQRTTYWYDGKRLVNGSSFGCQAASY